MLVQKTPEPEPVLPHLDRILARGSLRVATVNDPLTFYFVQEEPRGFEYELANRFAERLGVALEMVTVPRYQDLFEALENDDADLAAASITVTENRKQRVRFGPTYRTVTQEVVYKTGSRRPRSLDDLAGGRFTVIAGTSYAETLRKLQQDVPALSWKEQPLGDIETLFAAIVDQQLDFTVADSNIVDIHQRFYPSLKRAFSLSSPQEIAWAFPLDDDDSLINAAGELFNELAENQGLEEIAQRHFAHVTTYDKVNTHYFLRHIQTRLGGLQDHFQEASAMTGFDWKLLAAVGYQESHWKPDAVSPTGVRGVMMLTLATARQMGIDDRTDPAESILGGARYLARVKAKIPARIPEPDRTWLGLAAYNVGFGHLEDARILTQRRGGNPDRWADVAENLPLLSDRQWYETTRYGYARGREPVRYVRNIRSYYDILIWRLDRNRSLAAANAAP